MAGGAVSIGLAALVAPQGPRSHRGPDRSSRPDTALDVMHEAAFLHAAGRFHRGGGLSFSLCSRSPWRARQKPLIAGTARPKGGPPGRARYDEGSYGHRELLEGGPFPRKGVPPLSFPFESDVTTYSCARPMPGRAASRPAPRRKRPASSKALPMSCMPTGILLSAAMPTGRDRPGRPARFRDRV